MGARANKIQLQAKHKELVNSAHQIPLPKADDYRVVAESEG
jgi:hypothetical protein